MPSDSNRRLAVLVPESSGLAAGFRKADKVISGVSYIRLTKKGSLAEGNLLLELSMRQIMEIHDSLKQLNEQRTHRQLLVDVQSRYKTLLNLLGTLEAQSKEATFFEFSKKKRVRLDTQVLCDEGYNLYEVTKSTSDDLRRALIAYNISKIEEVEEPLPNEQITGISLRLDGPMDEETASLIAETASLLTAAEGLLDDEAPSSTEQKGTRRGVVEAAIDTETPLDTEGEAVLVETASLLSSSSWEEIDILSITNPATQTYAGDRAPPQCRLPDPGASSQNHPSGCSSSSTNSPAMPNDSGTHRATAHGVADIPSVMSTIAALSPTSPSINFGSGNRFYFQSQDGTNSQGTTQVIGGNGYGAVFTGRKLAS